MNIDEFIDEIGKKYEYSHELIKALKICIPAMIEGKTPDDARLLMETLDRVQIFLFDKPPKEEEIDDILERKTQEKGGQHVTQVTSYDGGEYEKAINAGGYSSVPVFNSNMDIIDRVGIIYLTNLIQSDKSAQFYGTNINLSHLIHELGHAWASQKEEYIQDNNGTFIKRTGTAKFQCRVNREKHEMETLSVEGLFAEEALNSIEEEKTLCKIYGVKGIDDIPGYVRSVYQGWLTRIMKECIKPLGERSFQKIRFQNDYSELKKFDKIFNKTSFVKQIETENYYEKKKKILFRYKETSMSEESKKKVDDFFDYYKQLYLTPHENPGLLRHIDLVLEQAYNFKAVKYRYDIMKEDIRDAYIDVGSMFTFEATSPIQEVERIFNQGTKKGKTNVEKE